MCGVYTHTHRDNTIMLIYDTIILRVTTQIKLQM